MPNLTGRRFLLFKNFYNEIYGRLNDPKEVNQIKELNNFKNRFNFKHLNIKIYIIPT